MKITHNSTANAWYIYLFDEIAPGTAVKQKQIMRKGSVTCGVILDYDKDNNLLGIEILE